MDGLAMDARELINPVHVLVVDDHPNTAAMLARVLTKFETPVEVVTASSGEDALEKTGDGAVDILITDFMMPGMNGLELIERLKGSQKPAYTILITAYDTPGLAIMARRLSVQEYLVKPVQPERIRSIVAKAVEELRPPVRRSQVQMPKRTFKILIADDYPDNLRLLSTRLQSEGYNFISAWDGEETISKVHQEQPDLVLLDVNMPKKDGFEVLAELRSDPAVAHIPVIMITAARINPKDVRDGLNLGADDYVVKPFDWRELAARIQSKLRVKQAEDILRRRTKELGVLPEIGQELSARLELEEVANIVVSRTVEALEAANARLDVFMPDGSVYCRLRLAGQEQAETLQISREQALEWGAAAFVQSNRMGLLVENTRSDRRWKRGEGEQAGSAVAVPLLGRQDVIGVLTLTHTQTTFFNTEHQTLLQAIASQAAIAIENAQLFGAERRRAQELMALNQITQDIHLFTHTSKLFESLPRLVQERFGYPIVSFWNGFAIEGEELKLVSLAGPASGVNSDVLVGIPQKAAEKGRPVLESDPSHGPSAAAAPLVQHGQVKGVLAVYSPVAGGLQEKDCVLLETLVTQVLSALERISLFESVEHEQRRLLAVLRSAADAILVIDSQGRLTLANPAGERLFEDAESHVGMPFPEGQGYDSLVELLNVVRTSGLHCQGEVIWPDGRTFSVLATPVEEGGQVAMLHDISQFKALAELKNEYIATASHDLKNPIMAVIGYNDLLAKAGPLTPMQVDFSKRISNAALQMRELVLNLLEISRLESGMVMKIEEVDLHDLLYGVARDFTDQAQAKGHQVALNLQETPVLIRGDRSLLQQMANNLLGNAIKYTPPNGEIVVSTRVVEDGKVTLRFRDNGYGMPEEALPKLFTKFYRVQTEETRDIEGTGLGLAIVKSIVENHGGQISVESMQGAGTTFTVNLPLIK